MYEVIIMFVSIESGQKVIDIETEIFKVSR